MSILVVGRAGHIGSHAVRVLQRAGGEVVMFDNFKKGYSEAVRDVPVFKGDLRRPDEIRSVFKQYTIEAVMHFSAYNLVSESMQYPELYYENNVKGTLNHLPSMQQAGIGRLFFSSTAATYGEPQYIPIDEAHPDQPTNAYGETKMAVECMLDWFDSIHGIKNVRLRFFNAAGADFGGEIGELHEP